MRSSFEWVSPPVGAFVDVGLSQAIQVSPLDLMDGGMISQRGRFVKYFYVLIIFIA
jgi:hypothetical protein